MQLFNNPIEAVFASRDNRFVVCVTLDGEELQVHAPNPGRLHELYLPGRRAYLETSDNTKRKYPHTLCAMEHPGLPERQVVPMVSSAANDTAAELAIPHLYPNYQNLQREVTLGKHRIDMTFDLDHSLDHSLVHSLAHSLANSRMLCEVKACSLVEAGIAMFPDAPSARAASHTRTLMETLSDGIQPLILFMITHGSPLHFIPNYHSDAELAVTLEQAWKAGVEIKAVNTTCTSDGTCSLAEVQPKVLLNGIGGIVASDTGWIVEYAPGNGNEWSIEVHPAENTLDTRIRELTRKGPVAGRGGRGLMVYRSPKTDIHLPKFTEDLEQLVTSAGGSTAPNKIHGELRWLIPGPPLFDEALNRYLFEFRHKLSLTDLTG